MSNIRDIADRAKVSPATVSRVLTGNGYVSTATRTRVEAIIRQLDYVPNQNAVSLKRGQTKTLGIMTPIIPEYLTIYLTRFTQIAQEYGYQVTILLTNYDAQKEREALHLLKTKKIDGLFVLMSSLELEYLERYTKYGPIVMWQRVQSQKVKTIAIDHYDAYRMAFDYLYKQGHRRILPFFGLADSLNTQARVKAWQDFCYEKKVPYLSTWTRFDCTELQDGQLLAEELKKIPQGERPSALFFPRDIVAVGFLKAAQKQSWQQDWAFSVMGFDGSELAELFDVTTVHYPMAEQAENAFYHLYNLLNEQQLSLNPLAFTLVEGKTVQRIEDPFVD